MPYHHLPTASLHDTVRVRLNGQRIPCRVEKEPEWFAQGFVYHLSTPAGTTILLHQPVPQR